MYLVLQLTTCLATFLLSFVEANKVPNSSPIPFSPGFDIDSVLSLAESLPSHSWEFGTASEALLELYNPSLSVFGSTPFPIRPIQNGTVKALTYAQSKIVIGTGPNGLIDGDGAVGDPASLGVSAVLLGIGIGETKFLDAAQEEVDYILLQAPRWSNGAISHRAAIAEVWADFIYMAPPFLAYYAVATSNDTLLQTTVTQCGLYRDALKANFTSRSSRYEGLWEHILGPQDFDPGLWSTGNGWAAAGMTRVLATILHAPKPRYKQDAARRSQAVENLSTWIQEILDGAIHSPPDGKLLRNYLNDTNSTGHGFGEISGSSLLASVAYRMAVLQPLSFGHKYVKWANGIRKELGRKDNRGNFIHISPNGTVAPAVNPLGWGDTTPFLAGSPEGQNFVVLMYAAWRDCVLANICKR